LLAVFFLYDVCFAHSSQMATESARLEAEAKAAEVVRWKVEAAEGKRKRELEREAARQALLKVTV
jgi:hypothetical protein